MSIIGNWKVAKVAVFDESFDLTLKAEAEIEATPENEEYKKMFCAVIEFTADGKAYTKLKVPEEALEEARAQGMPVDGDGYAVVEQKAWKEENGVFLYDTGNTGEAMGEAIDPFEPLVLNEDGSMLMPGGMMLLERI